MVSSAIYGDTDAYCGEKARTGAPLDPSLSLAAVRTMQEVVSQAQSRDS